MTPPADPAPSEVPGIRADAVRDWLTAHVADVTPPLRFELITGGRSNLTFRVTDAKGRGLVLRRPPLGAILATAHDMGREHRIQSALANSGVPVPPILGLCDDESVNDAPFYVMEYVPGHVLTDPESAATLLPDRAERHALGLRVIDVLADLHRVRPADVGLGDLGRTEAYLARQLKRWKRQWDDSKTRELPAMEEAHARLTERIPEQQAAAIVHGDFRLGNLIVRGREVRAVLDWELCTLGDPLADVAYLMNDWADPSDPLPTVSAGGSPSQAGGFPTRDELLERYAARTGFDLSGIAFYRAFQYWRAAAIVEGVMARYLKGVMGDENDPEPMRRGIDRCAAAAITLLDA